MAKEAAVKLVTPKALLAFPALVKEAEKSGKFEAVLIFRPADFDDADKARWKKIHAEIDRISKETFRVPYAKMKLNSDHRPMMDGADKEWNGAGEGTILIRMKTKFRPGIVDRFRKIVDGKSLDTSSELWAPEDIYPGMVVRACTSVWAYSSEQKGIKMNLLSLQIIADGERLDGRGDPTDDFDDDLPPADGDDAGDETF